MPSSALFSRIDLGALGTPEAGTPAPERILAGQPETLTWIVDESSDGKQFTGVWECTPGRWRVRYDEWEFCHGLTGLSVVTEDGGAPQRFGPGDTLILRPGFEGTWEVIERTRKLFVVRLP